MRSRLRDRERDRERDGERLLESSLDAALTLAGVSSEGSLPGGGGSDWRLSSGAGFFAASAARRASFVDGASAAGAGAAAAGAGAAGAGAAAGTNVGADGAGAGALIVESLPIVWASAVRGALQRLHSVRHWKLWLPQLAQSQSPGT